MKNQNINQEDASWLRQKAEEQLNRRKSETKKIVSETDMMKLIHELEVHQIELELQNKELVIAKEKAERAEEKYTELYDFAPSGYFTLSQQGNILEMNLHGAQMLGKERQTLLNNKLTLFIGKNTRTVFNDFLSQVFMGKSLASCEVSFVSGSKSPVYVIINGTLADDGKRCMISVMDITESRQAVEALRKSDDRLRTARDAMLDSFLIFSAERDEKGNIIDFIFTEMNANAEKMLQLSGKQLIGKRMCEELPINRTNGFFEKYRNVVETGIPLEEEFYLPDTHIPAAWYYHQVVRCDDGIVISHRDITRRKLMEKTLRENEERLRLALKATNDVVWDWDIVHDSQRWNEAGEKVFGWTEIVKNAVNAAWWMERIHPDDRQRVEDGFNAAVQNTSNIHWHDEYRFRKADGTYSDVLDRGYVLRDNKGEAIRMIGAMLDITERKKSELALIESEHLANTIANTTPALLYLYDIEKEKNIWANDAHKRFFEEMNEDASKMQFTDIVQLIHPEDLHAAIAHHNELTDIGNITRFNTELRIKCKGTWKWMRHLVTVFKTDYKAKPLQLLGALFDIDDQKKTEHDLLEAKEKAEESDRLKTAFLTNMSHEIRTPMNGILGFAALLKEPDLSGENQQTYIKIIEKSGKRMLNIINEIVDISKIEAGLMTLDINESNINDQIEEVYTFFKPEAEAKGINLSFKNPLSAKEATIKTDREKVYAILVNLVKNAIKYTHEGSIEFGYDVVETDQTAETRHALSLLQFYVKDTGIGIPKDRQEAIFERFIQADIFDKMAYQGAGLGLSISKSYVEMLGGKIWVKSSTGSGSTFYFTLPYNAGPVNGIAEPQVAPSEKIDIINKLKILVVEDDEVSESMLSIMLGDFSSEIFIAETGIEAVEICRQHTDIDVILMDIKIPGMNGYEAVRKIREFNNEVVIIAQTAYGLSGDREKSIESGCNDYIAKPFSKDNLLALIQKYFG